MIQLCEKNLLELISSDVLLFEINQNTNISRKEFAIEMLQNSTILVTLDEEVKERAKEIAATGIMALDALHLASAEKGEANFFCTCDDKLLKKAKAVVAPTMKLVSPLQLVEDLEHDNGHETAGGDYSGSDSRTV
ncbi:MAG: PIN domain-containing protein [Acidobacteria bacterium]|nr:PIN domain-containing protein [Acidobacteriota bacterium]